MGTPDSVPASDAELFSVVPAACETDPATVTIQVWPAATDGAEHETCVSVEEQLPTFVVTVRLALPPGGFSWSNVSVSVNPVATAPPVFAAAIE